MGHYSVLRRHEVARPGRGRARSQAGKLLAPGMAHPLAFRQRTGRVVRGTGEEVDLVDADHYYVRHDGWGAAGPGSGSEDRVRGSSRMSCGYPPWPPASRNPRSTNYPWTARVRNDDNHRRRACWPRTPTASADPVVVSLPALFLLNVEGPPCEPS